MAQLFFSIRKTNFVKCRGCGRVNVFQGIYVIFPKTAPDIIEFGKLYPYLDRLIPFQKIVNRGSLSVTGSGAYNYQRILYRLQQ